MDHGRRSIGVQNLHLVPRFDRRFVSSRLWFFPHPAFPPPSHLSSRSQSCHRPTDATADGVRHLCASIPTRVILMMSSLSSLSYTQALALHRCRSKPSFDSWNVADSRSRQPWSNRFIHVALVFRSQLAGGLGGRVLYQRLSLKLYVHCMTAEANSLTTQTVTSWFRLPCYLHVAFCLHGARGMH